MKLVPPDLVPCPECHYLLEPGNGPGGVAHHGCGMWPAQAYEDQDDGEAKAIGLAIEAADDPDLTMDRAALAYMRLVLHNAATTGEISGNPGDIFAGIGKFAATVSSDGGGLAGLLELLQRGDGD